MKLKNKVARVPGAVKGIGRGVGLDLAVRGCHVALTYFDWEESLAEMKASFARTGRIEDVIKAVRFILKDAPFMTGSVLHLDGGFVLGGEKVGPLPNGVS